MESSTVDAMDVSSAGEAWFAAESERLMAADPARAEQLARRQAELEAHLIRLAEAARIAPAPLGVSPPPVTRQPARHSPRIIIVGAGVSGLAMGARLLEAGYEDFVILEKSDDLGGTWHYNQYPGVACDVASYFYSFTFFKNPDWSQMFAPGTEIKNYLSELADHYGLRSRIRFGRTVDSCVRDKGEWAVSTAEGETYRGDILIPATGFLHIPRYPSIPRLETFKGSAFHTSRWPADLDLSGKRVGIIGTGSTAVQIVSNIVDRVAHLDVFQRTAQWVFPAPHGFYSEQRRRMLEHYPELTARLFQYFMDWYNDGFGNAVVGDKAAQKRFADACATNLASVADPELRARLTPDYPVMCKRLVFSTSYYAALQRPNCALVTEPIAAIEPEGIRLEDGSLRPLDVLILATGYDTHAYCTRLNIRVAGGPSLEEVWTAGARSFESIGLSGFPNLLFIGGPYSTVGNLSTVTCSELQVDHIIRLLDEMGRVGATTVQPHQDAEERFVAEMQDAVSKTVWVTGCQSWYLDPNGRVDIWTKTPASFMERMQQGPDVSNYELAS